MEISKLHQLHIEPTLGCNRKCWYCFSQTLKLAPTHYNFMTVETAEKLAEQVKKDNISNILFRLDGKGEPLTNPYIDDIIKILSNTKNNNRVALTTNGSVLFGKTVQTRKTTLKTEDYIEYLFECGLDYLLIDIYEPTELYDRLISTTFQKLSDEIEIVDFIKDNFNLHTTPPPKSKQIILIPDLISNLEKKSVRKLNNHAGNIIRENFEKRGFGSELDKKYDICKRPFRELCIYYDGVIVSCCEDGNQETKLGNIRNDNLKQIWCFNDKLNEIRKNIVEKNRNKNELCKKCTYNGS